MIRLHCREPIKNIAAWHPNFFVPKIGNIEFNLKARDILLKAYDTRSFALFEPNTAEPSLEAKVGFLG